MATKNSTDSPATEQAAETVQSLLERVTEHAAEAEERIRKAAKEAQSGLRDRADSARDNVQAISTGVQNYIHEHPMQALGIAFVGGMFLSSFLKRR